jgi:CubicO group peptidase (beta-lactamase class C family)
VDTRELEHIGRMTKSELRDLTAEVDAIFEKWNRTDSPGMAVGILQNGEVVLAKGYGMASLELGVSITPTSVFHVASVSKQFCAISVAMLAKEGKLDLDADIRTYVPEMPDLGYKITPRQLIQHTNGLRDQYGLFSLAGWRTGDAQEFDDVLDFAFRHSRLNFEPQTQYAYCNTSYTLLALMVQRVSGKNLREYTQENIFEPLGMTRSSFMVDRTEVIRNRANAYTPDSDGDGFKTMNANVDALGSICLYTCVDDLLRWARNFKERKVAADVLDEAMTSGVLSNGQETGYGFGLSVSKWRGLKTIGHGGVDSGYRSQITWFPEADFGVVVLSNLSSVKPAMLCNKIAELFLADKLGEPGIIAEPAAELSEDDLRKVTGIYMHPETNQTRVIELQEGKLMMPTGFGPDLEVTPVSATRFRVDNSDWELRFDLESDPVTMEDRLSSELPVTYHRVEVVEPSLEDLTAYVGSYHCPDIDAVHRVSLENGKLTIGHRKQKPQELKPAGKDTFVTAWTAYIFHRDGRGEVCNFQIFNDRIRYLQFNRL